MKPILHIPLFTILFSACLFITGLSTIKAEAESEEKDCSWGSTFIDYHNFPDTICSETVQFDVIHGYLDPGNPNDYYLECAKSTYLQIYDAASTLWITLDSGTSGANATWPDTINFNVTSEIATFLGDSFYCGRYYTFKYIVGTLNITFPNDTIHIIDSIYFDCGSSLDLNASIFTDPSIFPSCDPVLIYTSRNGNPTTHFNWTHGSLPGTFFSNNESITVADQNITNINVTLIDSSFGGQCDIGYDTLQTTIDYKGFEITISSNSNTSLNCSDPTNQLSFPDLYYADSALHNFSYQWFKRENGISTAIVGETNARLREVDQEGQYAVRATNSSTGCSDVSNYITISGISEEFYSLSIDGGNQLCLGENSPELNFTPPLPYPFPSSATMTVYDDGVSQAASTTINSEGYFYVEIEYAGGCKPYSDSLLVDLDTIICDSGFVISPNNFICTSDPVAMINRGTKNDSITYTWNFPGGLPSSYTSYYPPLVKYSSSGNYTITLIMSSTVSIDTFTKNISVSESCCDHDYSADSTVTFKNAALGFKDSITTYTGGGTFSGTYNVLGTIVLEDGIYTIEDGSNFFVDAACINCDYITQLEEICRNFTYDDKTQIILVGATLNMGDAEFRSSCDSMWYGIAAFQGSTISSLNDTSGQNALIMDAMAGISICDWPFEYEDNYYLDQVSFLNNIISMNDRDRSSNFNFIRNSHIDTDKDLMKAPYGNRYGLAGINLSGGHYYADFDNNFIANQLYGYYHRLIGDPGNTYHIKNNTLRDFYIVGMAIGGRNLTVNSEIINNDFYFTKSHIGSQSSPISAYSGYEGIPIYNTGVFGETGAAPVENEICGVYASGRLHCYGNRFFGFDSLLAPHVQSGITLTTLQGNVPNDVSFRENTFNDLGIGVRYMHASKEISENTFNNNKKAIRITNLSIHFDCLLDQNTFFENNMAIEVDNNTTITSTYELSLQENLFLDNDTAISVLYDNDTISLSMLMNCNKFQLDNTESYTRYGLFVHDSADIASVGGDNSLSDPNDPSGNGWPVDPSSTGYDSCITPGVGIDVTQWSSPSNWVSIEDNSTSTWKYFAYNNEFTGLFNPSGILDRQDPGVDAPSCAVQDICFPLARIMATLDIDENSKELVIYPNPSKEMIQIRSAGEKTIELIRIYDVALSKSPIELYLTGKRIEMNISVLTSGLYFLEVWNKDGSRDFARLIKK